MLRSSFGSFGSSSVCSSALERLHPRLRRLALVLGEVAHRRIARHLLRRGEVALGLAVLRQGATTGLDLGVLPGERAEAVHVARGPRRGEEVVELGQPGGELVELEAKRRFHGRSGNG